MGQGSEAVQIRHKVSAQLAVVLQVVSLLRLSLVLPSRNPSRAREAAPIAENSFRNRRRLQRLVLRIGTSVLLFLIGGTTNTDLTMLLRLDMHEADGKGSKCG